MKIKKSASCGMNKAMTNYHGLQWGDFMTLLVDLFLNGAAGRR
ncbi:hypothetical protein DOT_1232 [Desulfosporosinus sp. OT]|nr:hypothetical protein DOT_1232 [Desulfosporosinus sp. OT]